MPRTAKELSALAVKRLTVPGMHAIGGIPGLHLQVTPTGARSWILRFTAGVKPGSDKPWRRDLGLGGYPAVSLARAREKARKRANLSPGRSIRSQNGGQRAVP